MAARHFDRGAEGGRGEGGFRRQSVRGGKDAGGALPAVARDQIACERPSFPRWSLQYSRSGRWPRHNRQPRRNGRPPATVSKASMEPNESLYGDLSGQRRRFAASSTVAAPDQPIQACTPPIRAGAAALAKMQDAWVSLRGKGFARGSAARPMHARTRRRRKKQSSRNLQGEPETLLAGGHGQISGAHQFVLQSQDVMTIARDSYAKLIAPGRRQKFSSGSYEK